MARIKVDIPNSLDVEWKITVDKSDAQIPIKIQKRLKELISTIKIQSRRVFIFPGKKLTDSKINKLWELRQKKGKKNFKINLSHPLINDLLERSDNQSKQKNKNVINMIEETLPLHDLVAQMIDEQEAIIQHSTDPINIYEFGKYLYINLKSQGVKKMNLLKY